jgi:hypothetical protein
MDDLSFWPDQLSIGIIPVKGDNFSFLQRISKETF